MNVSVMSAEEIVDRYLNMVYRLAYARTGNVPDAEDITQEVFLKLIRSGQEFNDEEHVKAWLIRVTVNQVRTNATTAYNRHRADFEEAENISYETPNDLELQETQGEIRAAMKELPEKYSTVLHLFYFDELSVKQIAEALDTSEGTVKSQLSRGRAMLKTILQEEFDYA